MEEIIIKAGKELSARFATIRQYTEFICRPLKTEDYVGTTVRRREPA
jgi:hypothetical protein